MSEQDYEVMFTKGTGSVPVKAWTKDVPVESAAIEQLGNTARLPFIWKWLAAMADIHWGMGACVGSVIPTDGAVIPAAVGVDIGCSMLGVRTQLCREELFGEETDIRAEINMTVPTGRTDNGGDKDVGSWMGFPYVDRKPAAVPLAWLDLLSVYNEIVADDPALMKARTTSHLGTLGTGNHFIELAVDEEDRVWVVIHSGSRGIGNKIGMYFTKLAQTLCKKWFIDLPDPHLAYLPTGTPEFDRYWRALQWAQRYAVANKEIMMGLTLEAIESVLSRDVERLDEVHCLHNYAVYERHFGKNVIVTRKGAIRAQLGDRGIIPGSMGERTFIVKGKGNREAFNSASHGAGRVMSRTRAKKEITVAEHMENTYGVFCDKTEAVLDESPMAYKDIEAVMKAQESLVEVEHTLKAFINVKGVSEPRRKRGKR